MHLESNLYSAVIMATTTTEFNPNPIRFSYIGLPPDSDVTSPIPKAEINFIINAGVVTAAASGEDQEYMIHCALAPGYAYVLMNVNMYILAASVADSADWEDNANAWTSNANVHGGQPDFVGRYLSGLRLEGITTNPGNGLGLKTYQVGNVTNNIILPLRGYPGALHISNINDTIDGGALTMYFVARFLEFDLQQAHHWAINTPWPTR